ncbi:Uncharacterized protein TCM_031897 [Theobroma cacao]|uniref:RNase H type-1 domain-containing protein n=1 Tax=Theobroma cacao TaxID=3641 RepID=A0A061F8Y8_THECC|nr:Uncharacterized protein TCM_031897 [Theobroma cacao]
MKRSLPKGKPGPAGIGGLLRDHLGFIRGTFSNHIGTEDSNLAEFKAIHEGLKFFLTSPWASSHNLVIERDSSNGISWVKDHKKVPWRMKNLSTAIEVYLHKYTRISFNHVKREANTIADGLSKAGVIRNSNFKANFEIHNREQPH